MLCVLSIQVRGTWWMVINMYSIPGKGGSGDIEVRFISILIIDES